MNLMSLFIIKPMAKNYTSQYSEIDAKRKRLMTSFALLLPAYYIIKNRNIIYRATEVNRIFFLKETLMRSFLGACVGFGISLMYYGGD